MGALVLLEHLGGADGVETICVDLLDQRHGEGRRFELAAGGGSLMDGSAPEPGFGLGEESLGMLMPMHLSIGVSGHIRSAGPTLLKVFRGDALVGRLFHDVFSLRGRGASDGPVDLARLVGRKLFLARRAPPMTSFKGMVVPLEAGRGLLLNLSFGIHVDDAVRDHDLTDADFAPTDLVIEMLFLSEAKSAVMEELRRLNHRLRGAKQMAEEQALTDAVTGLRNRRAMERALQRMVEVEIPFGLLSIDLDYFKQVNDTMGHAAGDHVLGRVAQILNTEVRGSDLAARVGGDEFVMLFPGLVDPAKLDGLAHRILARLEEPIPFEGQLCRISGSFGTVMVPAGARATAEELLSRADRALYASKRSGRGRVTAFTTEMDSA